MGNILDLDIDGRRVEQVEPAAREHLLPGAGLRHGASGVAPLLIRAQPDPPQGHGWTMARSGVMAGRNVQSERVRR
jgi:hypothetical protein